MEAISVNASIGKARRTVWRGREFFVAPLTLLVSGTLKGSKGSLYYPPEEIGRDPGAWNGMPIVVQHPVRNGYHVSARSPDVLESSLVGHVYNINWNERAGKLRAEGWFDSEWAKAVDPRVYEALERGKAMEVSTGLFTRDLPAGNGAVDAKGRPYDYVATGYRPDHLAVLPDSRGACSLDDGCGLNVNEGKDGYRILEISSLSGNSSAGGGGPAAEQTGLACVCGGSCDSCKSLLDTLTPRSEAGGGSDLPEGAANPTGNRNRGWIGALKKAFGEYVYQAGEDTSSGLRVWANTKEGKVVIDVMDWGDSKLARKTVGRAAAVLGEGGVTWQNEGGSPRGEGWIELDAPTHNEEDAMNPKSLASFLGAFLPSFVQNWFTENSGAPATNALPNQPRSLVSGKYKAPNAGTGKGEAHAAAQSGNLVVTAEDEALGADALRQKVETGHNPPDWSVDEGKWEKAKEAAGEDDGTSGYWAKVTAIYKRMGGSVRGKTENDATPSPALPATASAGVGDPAEGARVLPGFWVSGGDEPTANGGGGVWMLDYPEIRIGDLLLTNAELGEGSAFASDDLREEAFARMAGYAPTVNDFDSEEQQKAFFGMLRAAGKLGPSGGAGSATAGGASGGAAGAATSGEAKTPEADAKAAEDKSAEAVKRSAIAKKVNKDRQSNEHAKASALHLEAAEMHARAGNQGKAEDHFRAASEHEAHSKRLEQYARNEEGAAAGPPPPAENNPPSPNQPTSNEGGSHVDRKGKIDFLTANCSCWKGEGDRAVLEKFSDAKLDTLVKNAEEAAANALVANAAKEGFRHDGRAYRFDAERKTFVTNAPKMPPTDKRVPPEDPEDLIDGGADEDTEMQMQAQGGTTYPPAVPPRGKKGPPMATNNTQPVKLDDWMRTAPPEVQATVNYAMGVERAARAALVERIVSANAATAEGQAAIRPVYEKMGLPTLQLIANQLPPPAGADLGVSPSFGAGGAGGGPSFFGAATPPTVNSNVPANDEADYLPLPTVNWAESCSPFLKKAE